MSDAYDKNEERTGKWVLAQKQDYE